MDLYIDNSFIQLNDFCLMGVDGGTFWGVVGGVGTVICGAGAVVGGAGLLAVPDPTTLTKWGGYAAVTSGIGTMAGGCASIGMNI